MKGTLQVFESRFCAGLRRGGRSGSAPQRIGPAGAVDSAERGAVGLGLTSGFADARAARRSRPCRACRRRWLRFRARPPRECEARLARLTCGESHDV